MTQELERKPMRLEWREEQLRFRILRAVYDRAGADCEHAVSGTEIGTDLDLRFEELFRGIHFLEYHGYLNYLSVGPKVCLTAKGIAFIEEDAGRRRSVRHPPAESWLR